MAAGFSQRRVCAGERRVLLRMERARALRAVTEEYMLPVLWVALVEFTRGAELGVERRSEDGVWRGG